MLMHSKLLALALLASPVFAVQHIDKIQEYDATGADTTNFTFYKLEPFIDGEILTGMFPQVGFCATDATCATPTWLTTQANVTRRSTSGNGNVIESWIAAIIPTLTHNTANYVTFRPQNTCNCGPALALTKSQMLANGYNFDTTATFGNAGVSNISESARTMLSAWPQTTLAAAITTTTTGCITPTSTTGFPVAGTTPFDLIIGGDTATPEEMRVNNIGQTPCSGGQFNVSRGWNGTTAATHLNGASVWDTMVRYRYAGSVATVIELFDPITKRYDFGYQRVCNSTLTDASLGTGATSWNVSSTACWPTAPFFALISEVNGSGVQAPDGQNVEIIEVNSYGPTSVTSATRTFPPSKTSVSCCSGGGSTVQIWPENYQTAGSDTYKNIRPKFYAIFWNGQNLVQPIRATLENSDTTKARDVSFTTMTVTEGCGVSCSGATSTVWSQAQSNPPIWFFWGQRFSTNHYSWDNLVTGNATATWTIPSPSILVPKEMATGSGTVMPPAIQVPNLKYMEAAH